MGIQQVRKVPYAIPSRGDRAVEENQQNLFRNFESLYDQLVPIGVAVPWMAQASVGIPQGFLLCDGSAVLRTTYSNLFDIIGTAWGAGDGNTTFNLPDLRDRTVIGQGSVGVTIGTVIGSGTTTSAHTHDLSNHTHTMANHVHSLAGHTHGGSTTGDTNHVHVFSTGGRSNTHSHTGKTQSPSGTHGHDNTTNQYAGRPTNVSAFASSPCTDGDDTDHTHSGTTAGEQAGHSHNIPADNSNTGGANSNTSDGPAPNVTGASSSGAGNGNYMPSGVARWIIRF